MAYLHCVKCLCVRTDDVIGAKCRTPDCDGIISEAPTFASLVDELPEPMTCGRRDGGGGGLDRWQKFKSNGNRVCSYCGSLHQDDMFALVRDAASVDSKVKISPSDKSYKIYVRQPGVRNAHEGGIKFYTHHLPDPLPANANEEFAAAVKASRARSV